MKEKTDKQGFQELECFGIEYKPELKRIYDAILEDFEKWNQEIPIREYVIEIVEKRLLVIKEEAIKIVEELFRGIIEYKEAKVYLKNNPEFLEEIKKYDIILEKILNPLTILAEVLKETLSKEGKDVTNKDMHNKDMHYEEKEFEIDIEEVANALTIYIGGKTDISEKVPSVEAGTRGAYIHDVAETSFKYINGEIDSEQLTEELVEKIVASAIAPIIK